MPLQSAVLVIRLAAVAALALVASGCSQGAASAIYPTADLCPPGLLAAGPTDSRSVVLRFDEPVSPVEDSYGVQPGCALSCRAEDKEIVVSFASDQLPGADYVLSGEAEDLRGNRTRFLLRFAGWNDRAPPLRLSEIQTGKNGSKINPHRDFLEFEVMADGNLGGEEVSWTSTVKAASYRFPGIETRKGDFVVLHLAPEGGSERDELGSDLSASGGVDSSANGRDLWCSAMALPDESGAVAISIRPGDQPMDGLFYAAEGKAGALDEGRLADMLSSLVSAGAWPEAGDKPAWEDGFSWKCSASRSICRGGAAGAKGASAWYLTASGGQSPGAVNSGPDPAGKAVAAKASAKAPAKKAGKKVSAKKP